PLAEKIRNEGAKFRIIITIENRGSAKSFLKTINKRQLNDIIINTGSISREEIFSLYDQVDSLLLPTLLESLSSTYLDAMNYGKTVYTSDREFAKSVCGTAAYYFNPFSATDIYETILSSYENDEERERKILLGKERMSNIPNWKEVAERYITEMKNILEKN
ncbi:MAG: glycosyltransferase family 4 protein, partial [Asgard group archaeon]|nr:glycosyltransferase family 4 protein [Asgard group archaeon]